MIYAYAIRWQEEKKIAGKSYFNSFELTLNISVTFKDWRRTVSVWINLRDIDCINQIKMINRCVLMEEKTVIRRQSNSHLVTIENLPLCHQTT